jgi:DNA-binding transcriptional ArsR family regulator
MTRSGRCAGSDARRGGGAIPPPRRSDANELEAADEIPVGELAERAGVGLSNTSKHLHQLERAGLVGRRRVGTTILYRVADPVIPQLCEIVCASLRRRYAALAEQA